MTSRFGICLSAWRVAAGLLLMAMPSAAQIVTPVGGNIEWTNPAGWSTGRVPGGSETPQVSTGTVTVNGTVSVGTLNLFGGAITNPGTSNGALTLTGLGSEWRAGTLHSSSGGAFTLRIASGANLSIGTGSDHDFSAGNIVIEGTTAWTGGNLRSGNGGSLTIAAGGTLNDSASGSINNAYGGATSAILINQGAFNKTTTGITYLQLPFTNSGNLTVSAGTLRLDGGASFTPTANVVVGANSTLQFDSSVSVADAARLSGAGAYLLAADTLTLTGNFAAAGGFTQTGGTLAGNHRSDTPVVWSGGNWNSAGTTTIGANSTFTLSGAIEHDFNTRNIVIEGTAAWTGGNLRSGNGGSLTIAAGGTLNDSASGYINNAYGGTTSATLINQGAFNKTTTGITYLQLPFTNSGNLTVSAGTLKLDGGASFTPTANVVVGANSTLQFDSAVSVADAARLSGAGAYRLSADTLTLTGNFAAAGGFTQTGGTLAGTHRFDTPVVWSGGNWSSAGSTTIGANTTLTVSGAIEHDFNTRNIVINGTADWNGGNLRSGNGGSLTIATGGTLNDSASGYINNAYGGTTSATLINQGAFNKTTTGITYLQLPFTNSGNLTVSAGTLKLDGGASFTSTAKVVVGANSTLQFDSNVAVADAASFSGAGNFLISGGNLTLSSGTATTSGTVTLAGGAIGGTGTLTTSAPFNWTYGDLKDGGVLNANAGGAWSSTSAKYLYNHIVNLAGTTTWSAGPLYTGGGSLVTIKPGATFTTNFDGGVYHNLGGNRTTFDNQGTFTKSAGTGTTSVDTTFTNSGTVNIVTGTLDLGGGGSNSGTIDLASGATLGLSNGTFAVTANSSITGNGTVRVSGGITTFAGSNTNSAGFMFTGGNATFSSTTSTSGNVTLAGGTIGGTGTLTTSGAFNWTYGDLKDGGILNANAGGAWSSGHAKYLYNHIVNLAGTTTWSEGPLYTGGGSLVTIKPGATFTTNFDGGVYHNLGGNRTTFDNQGTFTKSAGTGTTSVDAVFTNSGTVNIVTGTLDLGAGGSNSGSIDLASGATLALTGGTFAVTANSSITGNGTVRVSGGTTTFAGSNTNSANFALTGGTATFNGATATTGGGTISGGDLIGTGSLSLGGLLTISGGDLNGTGTLSANGGANITNTFTLRAGQTLSLAGNSTWSAGYIYQGTGSVLNNTGTLTNTGNTPFYHNYGGTKLTFNNSGTFTKSTATGDSYLDAIVNNTGTINVQSGSVSVGGGGSSSGTIDVASGATFALANGNFTFTPGSTVTGAGTIRVSGGTTTFSGSNTNSAHLALSGGTASFSGTTATTGGGTISGGDLIGTGSLSLGGLLTISGGDLNGTGTLSANGGANITNTFTLRSGQTLSLAGNSTWSGGYIYQGTGSVLNNTGTLTNTGNTPFYHNYGGTKLTFNNSGTFTKSTATGDSYLDGTVNNTGTINVQSGSVSVGGGGTNSGTIDVASGATFALANGNFTFTPGSTVTGAGTIRVSGGTTTFAGSNTNSAHLALSGGTASFSGATATTGGGTISGGDLNGTGSLTLGGLLTISGGDLSGTGTLSANGGANITNTFSLHSGRILTLAGNSTWSAGYIYQGIGSVLNNTGTLTNTGNTPFYHNYGGTKLTFNNSGTFTKSTATGDSYLDGTVNNTGTINVQSGSVSVGGGGSSSGTIDVASGATFALANGNFTFAPGSTVTGAGTILVSGGTTNFSGNNTGTARISLSGGIAAFNGTTSTTGGGTISGGSFVGSGSLTLGGLLTISGGDLNGSGSLIANGGVNITNSFSLHSGRTLTLAGNSTWSGGSIFGGGYSVLTVKSGATFTTNVNGSLYGSYYGGGANSTVFDNQGTFTKAAAATSGTTDISAAFNNSGTVNVESGRLALRGGGTDTATATFSVAAGATLAFDGGTHQLANGSSLAGAGTYSLESGVLAIAKGTANIATLVVSGGVLDGPTSTAAITSLNQTAGSLAVGVINLAANSTWSGGDWNSAAASAASIASDATLTLSGGYRDFNRRTIVNNGIVEWQSGHLRTGNGGSFLNSLGAIFKDLQPHGYQMQGYNFGSGTNAASFTNLGTYLRNAPNTTYLDIPFHNQGFVSVLQGDLQFRAGGTLAATGTIAAATGTNVYFTEGYSVENGVSLTGTGRYWLTGGDFTLNGQISVPAFYQTGGTLAGTGVISGAFHWHGGNWNAATSGLSTTINATGTLNLSEGGFHDFNARAIVNQGTVNWSSGYLRSGNDGSFTNAADATFNDLNASGYSVHNYNFGGANANFAFINQGTYVRNTTGTTSFDTTFHNTGTLNLLQGDIRLQEGGTMGATSVVNVATGAHLYFTSNYTLLDGARFSGPGLVNQIGGTLTLNGHLRADAFTWSGGNWNATGSPLPATTIAAGTVLNLSHAHDGYRDFNGRAIVNQGTVNWESGYLRSGNDGSFTNAAGATFNDRNASGYTIHESTFGGANANFAFINQGAYVRNTTGTTYFDTTFHNTGTLHLQQGDIQVRAGGTMGATSVVDVSAGAHLYFTTGYTLLEGARFSGPGLVNQTGGTLVANGLLRADAFTWSGGNWNATGSPVPVTTIAVGTVLELSHAHDSYRDFNGRAIVNQGTVNWSSGYLRSGNDGSFTNAAGATFNDRNASGYTIHESTFGGANANFAFINQGTYVRNTTGTTYFDTTFHNTGTLHLQLGDIQVRGGGTMGATSVVNVSAGAHLYFTSNYTLLDGAQFSGPGLVNQTGGTLTANGHLRAATFTWSGGNWNAPAAAPTALSLLPTTTIAAGSVLELSSGHDGYRDFAGRAILNQGTVNWRSAYLRGGDGSTFTNAAGATFNDLNASGYSIHNPFGGTFTFTNAGAYVKSTAGTTTIQVPFTNTGSILAQAGTLAFTGAFTNDGGSLLTAGGNFSFSGGLNVGTGTLGGTGTITGNVTAGGLVSPGTSPGQLTIAGNLTLLRSSTTLFELGGTAPGLAYDFLNVTGSAGLDGTLELRFVNNFQNSAQPTDTFTLLTASTALNGNFFNVPTTGLRLFTADGQGSFLVNFGPGSAFAANSLVLSQFVPVPEPSTWALLLTGGLLLTVRLRRRSSRGRS